MEWLRSLEVTKEIIKKANPVEIVKTYYRNDREKEKQRLLDLSPEDLIRERHLYINRSGGELYVHLLGQPPALLGLAVGSYFVFRGHPLEALPFIIGGALYEVSVIRHIREPYQQVSKIESAMQERNIPV